MFQTLTLPPSFSPLQFQSPSPKSSSIRCTAAVRDRPTISTSSTSSLYELLKVKRDASLTEIKSAYRNLAKQHHPDATDGSDGRDFIEIRQAYETLSDPATRAVYDMSLGFGGRLTSASFGCDSGRRRSPSYTTTRRWETDQCW